MPVELGEQAVQIIYKGSTITAALLWSLAQHALDSRDTVEHGQQSLQKLNLQGQLESVKITGQDITAFRKQLNKYAVDFSVKRDRNTGEYSVFFKGRDTERVYLGLENVLKTAIDRTSKKPIKEIMARAVQKAAERAAQQPQSPEKNRFTDRGER
jgi:hypothetical protein